MGNYALAFANAITSDSQGFDANGDVFKGTFLDYVKNYSSTLGEDVSFAESRKTASSSIIGDLEDSRDEVSGVVVDEEVTNMQIKTIVFRLKESNMQATFRLRNEQKQILKKIKATNKSPAAQAARFSSPTAQRGPGKLGKA